MSSQQSQSEGELESDLVAPGILKGLHRSIHLLSRRDRLILAGIALLQMATSILDLAGVLLIGLVTASALSSLSGDSQSPTGLLSWLPIDTKFDQTTVLWLAAAGGVLLMGKSILNILLTRASLRFLARRQAIVSARLTSGLMERSILFIESRSSQQRAFALTTGVNFAILMVLGQGVIVLTEGVLLIMLTIGLMLVSPIVTVFSLAFFVVVAVTMHRFLSLRAGRLGSSATETEIASFAAIQEAMRSYREVIVANRRGFYVDAIRRYRLQAADIQADLSFVGLVPKYVLEVALVIGGGLLVLTQMLTRDLAAALTVITLFLVAASRIIPSLLRLQGALLVIRSSAGQAMPTYRLADDLRVQNPNGEARASHAAVVAPTFVADVHLDDVWFTYPNAATPAIAGVSLRIPQGSSLAIAGPTGSGKSTLADLVLGVLEPDSGGVTISCLRPSAAVQRWPGNFGYVPQHVAISNTSLRENVALGVPAGLVDEDAVWRALGLARLADVVSDMPAGLDTLVGENGVRLSGGQRQRLGLARALYSSPELLVLDEATSALDAETEDSISAALGDVHGQVTTILIAHRLATVLQSDQVVYLVDGTIAAQGRFEEVREQSPAFDKQARLMGL